MDCGKRVLVVVGHLLRNAGGPFVISEVEIELPGQAVALRGDGVEDAKRDFAIFFEALATLRAIVTVVIVVLSPRNSRMPWYGMVSSAVVVQL